jgi:hypothetical protein
MRMIQLTNKSPIRQVLARMYWNARKHIERARRTVECFVRFVKDATRIRMELSLHQLPSPPSKQQ